MGRSKSIRKRYPLSHKNSKVSRKRKTLNKRRTQLTSNKRMKGGAWLKIPEGGFKGQAKQLTRVDEQSGVKRLIPDVKIAELLYKKMDKSTSWDDFIEKNKIEYEEKYDVSFDSALKRLDPGDIGENLSGSKAVPEIISRDIEQWCPIGKLNNPIKYFKTASKKQNYTGIEIFHRYYGRGTIIHYDNRKMGYGWLVEFPVFGKDKCYTFWSTNSFWLGSMMRKKGKKGQRGNILIKQPPEYLIEEMWMSYTKGNKANVVLRDKLFNAMKSYPLVYSEFCNLVFTEDSDVPKSLTEETTKEVLKSGLNEKGLKLWELDKKHRKGFRNVKFPSTIKSDLNIFHKFCLFLKRFQDENDQDIMIDEWWDFYKKSKINYNFLGKYSKSADMTGGSGGADIVLAILVCLVCLGSQFQCLLIFLMARK